MYVLWSSYVVDLETASAMPLLYCYYKKNNSHLYGRTLYPPLLLLLLITNILLGGKQTIRLFQQTERSALEYNIDEHVLISSIDILSRLTRIGAARLRMLPCYMNGLSLQSNFGTSPHTACHTTRRTTSHSLTTLCQSDQSRSNVQQSFPDSRRRSIGSSVRLRTRQCCLESPRLSLMPRVCLVLSWHRVKVVFRYNF